MLLVRLARFSGFVDVQSTVFVSSLKNNSFQFSNSQDREP